MSATNGRRGIVMILVLVLVALLLIVALAVITGSNTAAQSATAVSIKYRVLNAAEGATNAALDDLVKNPAEKDGKQLSGTLNGVDWKAWILANNLLGQLPGGTYHDPTTGEDIAVPVGSAYVSGSGVENGGHTTSVDAMVDAAPPFKLPPGALNANRDVLDTGAMMIAADPLDVFKQDANINANRNIVGATSTVQGKTFAVGSDDLPGVDGKTHPNSSAVPFPLSTQVDEVNRTANLSAQAGTNLTPAQIQQAGTTTYKGDVYVNGDLVVDSSTITFSSGKYVYVNGNLCVSGVGRLNDLNSGTNEIVVSGNVEIANGGTYATDASANTLMLVLGLDNAGDPCSSQNVHAVDFAIAGSLNPIGTIYAANGSIDLTGSGSIAGALDAGFDILLEGSNPSQGLQYSLVQANTSLNTGTLTFQSYSEQ